MSSGSPLSGQGRTARLTVVAPASPIAAEALAAGLEVARALGIDVDVDTVSGGVGSAKDGAAGLGAGGLAAGARFWLNGDDEARARHLVEAVGSPGADGLWMARGGYGSARALGVAAVALGVAQAARQRPASMWGFSDGTVLVGHWADRGWESWLAPPVSQLPRLDDDSLERLADAMSGRGVRPFEGLVGLRRGVVEGRLVGGNLAVLCSLVGTPMMPRLDGGILVVEDVNEAAYRVDRMFQQLVGAGVLDGVVGLVVGDFTGVSERELEGIAVVVDELASQRRWVCASGLPVGHGGRNACLPMGRRARLEVDAVNAVNANEATSRLSVGLGGGREA